jgi:hypothetical protein
MMHGHEKSDSVIVAVKPANKVEHSAAEPHGKLHRTTKILSHAARRRGGVAM